jgi:PAS domain S-box-containing protein
MSGNGAHDSQFPNAEASEFLWSLYEHARDGVVQVASDGRLRWVNPALCRMLGYNENELLDKAFEEIVHPEDRARQANLLQKILTGKYGCYDAEERFLHRTGTAVSAIVTSLLVNGNGPGCYCTTIVRDVSQSKEATANFGLIVESAPNAMVLIGDDRSIILANAHCQSLFGYERGELTHQPIELLLLDKSELSQSEHRGERAPFSDGHMLGRCRELVGLHKSGTEIPVEMNLHAIRFQHREWVLASITDMTDRKRALHNLQESEERFRTIFNDAPTGMALTSTAGRFIFVNNALCDFLGYGRNELSAKNLLAITYPDDKGETLKQLKQLEEGELPNTRIEQRYVHKNGQLLWGDVRRSLIRDSQTGKPRYIVSQIVDITERKRIEQELRRREAELKEAQRLAQVGSWTWERAGDGIRWSDEMYRIHGLDPHLPPPSYNELSRLFTVESWELLKTAIEEAWETGKLPNADLELIRPDGSRRWISARGEAERDARGGKVRLRGTAQDITDRKRMEQSLRETEERFRTIADSAPVLIWMSGPDTLRTYFNRRWLDFTGRRLERELKDGWIQGVHPHDLVSFLESYTKSFDEHVPFTITYRVKRHDGEYRWLIDSGTPRFNPDGSFAGYIGSCIDETDRRAAEEVLRNVSRKLIEAQEKERKRIARELHDDINQRLAMLAIELQQLDSSPIFQTRRHERIERLLKRTTEISSDLQALSHELHSVTLEHLGLAAAMRSFCNDLARHQKVKVDFTERNFPGSVPPDIALALLRVLQEGVHNAVKHSGVRKFQVELVGGPREIQLTVRDFGAGFDPQQAAKGEGLGLMSMKERILPFKGTLSIASKPKQGTELVVRIPIQLQAADH